MRERMLAGEPYLASDPELGALGLAAQELTDAYNATTAHQHAERRALLERLLGSIGEDTSIRPPLHVDYGTQISIGSGCFVNWGLVAADVATITIGDHVQIGPGVQLLTPTHPVEPGPRREGWEGGRPIVLGDNTWLGGAVVVLPGVSIGADTVVGAGSVVTRDLPPGVVAVGNPARVVRAVPRG